MIVLVTGATGYVGGRLVPRLLERGHVVRVLARDPTRLEGRSWTDAVAVVTGDVLRPETLVPALQGVDVAYYLVHSMQAGAEFHRLDLEAARAFGLAAKSAGVARIVYLGGLGDAAKDLSEHLRSRQETGRALAEAGVPVTEFRAGVVVGSGSLSFEIVRNLAERLPVMTCPRWVFQKTHPIAIRNVLDYLVAALDAPESVGRIIEIGGADTVTYADMVQVYAKVRGLRRWLVPVPILTPRLSSYWVHWTTPVPASIARPLIEGLRYELVVRDPSARRIFPDIVPMGYEQAVRLALDRFASGAMETRWTDPLVSGRREAVKMEYLDGMIQEHRETFVDAPPQVVFDEFSKLGGARGWLGWNWAWRLRAALDRAVGGVGYRGGRRDPDHLRVGDAVDFWRVEAVEPGRSVRLRAEMKVPGRAWIEFRTWADESGRTRLAQTAHFSPRGLFGLAYWYALYPVHALIFRKMIRRLAECAESSAKFAAKPRSTTTASVATSASASASLPGATSE
ncbi:MAG: SDR family oxidoreductase [Planctomycetes bacterium]|nr:SDR family oxidoreductase [Planctomycetota bacterium]